MRKSKILLFDLDGTSDILLSSGEALVRVNEKIICSSSFSAIETKNFIESARKICGTGGQRHR